MSIKIHSGYKEKLLRILEEELPNIEIKNNIFIDRTTVLPLLRADKLIPERGDEIKKLKKYVGDDPVLDFIYETISQDLRENEEYSAGKEKKNLNEIKRYKNIQEISNNIVKDLESLPWKYTFTIPFHEELAEKLLPLIKFLDLGKDIKIKKIDEDFKNDYPLVTGNKIKDQSIAMGMFSLLAIGPPDWGDNTLCIQFEGQGFVGFNQQTSTTIAVLDKLKSFFGLAIALRIFNVERKYRPTALKAKIFMHRELKGKWEMQRSQNLEEEFSTVFHDLVLEDADGYFKDELSLNLFHKDNFIQAKKVYTTFNSNERILLASQWLFDSYCTNNDLLSFVQVTVAAEILLGDKASSDELGLGVLLRNRCAYLIGTTQEQRDGILDDFKEIYNVRSKIVHAGKNRITKDEWQLFNKLRWMCKRIIQEEVKLLKEST